VTEPPVLDVSGLPTTVFDTKAPLWWGNLWLLMIETTMFGLVVASYFYIRLSYSFWPPPLVEGGFLQASPQPDLMIPTINLGVILASCVPMFLLDRAARRADRGAALVGVAVCILMGLVAISLRLFEFSAVKFKWDSNAYGSVVWAILVLHLLHLLTETLEVSAVAAYVVFRDLDDHSRFDLTVTAVYWYWVAAVWIPLYLIIYWGPRVL
jgi:cytochrome c oxidase subunit 3